MDPRPRGSPEDGGQKLHLRLRQVQTALLTVLAAAWLVTLGPIPGLVGLIVAQHLFVAFCLVHAVEQRDEQTGDGPP